MAGLAERYWRELRPSTAGRHRLEVGARCDREGAGRGGAGRDLRRPRWQVRPVLRVRSR